MMASMSSESGNKVLFTESKFIVVGLGPAGLAVSLLLGKLGKEVVVYEKQSSWESLLNAEKQSYPIGINERTLACLDEIDGNLRKVLIRNSIPIKSWMIRDILCLKSSACYSSTRGYVIGLLYDHLASRVGSISINVHFGCEVTDIDILQRRLYIKQKADLSDFHRFKTIDFADARVLACDGVNSIIREACCDPSARFAFLGSEESKEAAAESPATKSIVSSTQPCHKVFRVLFADDEDTNRSFDREFQASCHSIYEGLYISCVLERGKHKWIMSIAIDASIDPTSFLVAKTATPENLSSLRRFLFRSCPLLKHVLCEPQESSADPLAAYFDSPIYQTSIVTVDRLNFGEILLLLGDAAHAVVPPVGEGLNASLEDAMMLYQAAQRRLQVAVCSGPHSCQEDTLFAEYNDLRIADTQSLSRIAITNNANFDQPERSARLLLRLLQAILRNVGLLRHTGEDYMYGSESKQRLPYGKIEKLMRFQQLILMPLARMCTYPLYYLYVIMCRVFAAVLGTGAEASGKRT